MATEEITISELELATEVLADMTIPVDTATETRATTLGDVKKWLDIEGAILQALPTGVILPFGGSSAPTGYLICDGAKISRTTYANLFAKIGTTYGAGDGATTFALPNYSSARMVTSATVGVKGNGKSLGITGGTKSGGWRSGESSGQIAFMGTSYGNTADKASGSQNPGAYYIGVVTNTANSGLTGTASLATTCKFIIKY
jgi:microcystin-dependent protein